MVNKVEQINGLRTKLNLLGDELTELDNGICLSGLKDPWIVNENGVTKVYTDNTGGVKIYDLRRDLILVDGLDIECDYILVSKNGNIMGGKKCGNIDNYTGGKYKSYDKNMVLLLILDGVKYEKESIKLNIIGDKDFNLLLGRVVEDFVILEVMKENQRIYSILLWKDKKLELGRNREEFDEVLVEGYKVDERKSVLMVLGRKLKKGELTIGNNYVKLGKLEWDNDEKEIRIVNVEENVVV